MDQFDAIIVGARVAGATTALLLAQRGYRVLLVDQDRFPSTTLSTHLFFTDTLDVFERIGVLDRVLAVDAPRLRRLRFPYVDAPFAARNGRDFALCIRREVLDAILVEAAAAEPNIELRTGTRLTGLLRQGERVVGVRLRPVGGQQTGAQEARARIVIGADGRHSRVAREAGAPSYHEVPPLFAWYYGYFAGVPLDEPASAWAVRTSYPAVGADYAAAFVFPCDAGLTLVGFGVQHDAFPRFRRGYRAHYLQGVGLIPEVAARLGDAELTGPVVGSGDLANFLRRPCGPGWALVGDAGCHKDPHTIQGIGDATRGAVLLAGVLDAWWQGATDEASALERYHAARDADVLPMYDFTVGALEASVEPEVWQAFGRRTWADPALAARRVAATAHAIDPASVYAPGVVRALASAELRAETYRDAGDCHSAAARNQ